MRPFSTCLLLATVLAIPGAAQEPAEGPNPAAPVEHLITPDSIAGPVRFLADDLLEGRGPGSRGDELARLYIATQFQLLGLEPAGPDGAWEQEVPITGITATVEQPLAAAGPEGQASFTAPRDYTVNAGGPDPVTAWEDAELVFAGYGIHAPEEDWDDFKGQDVSGKVLLVMNNDPSDDPDLFAGRTRLYYGRWTYKFEEAARRGAAGAMVIHTTPSAGYPFNVIQAGHGKEDFHLPFEEDTPRLALETWCSEEAARKLAALGGHDLDRLRRQAESREFRPVPLGVRVNLSTHNRVRRLRSANVLGLVRGRDAVLGKETVVVTAHFDHLGMKPGNGEEEDRIYNGALDNASGTSALINLARAVAAMEHPPRRSILFAAVTAEESGLLGSAWYARNPTIPVPRLVADFNIDGINIWGRTRDISMVGYGKNTLTDLTAAVAARRGRVLVPDQDADKGLFYRSDHFSFAKVGVPSAYFKAGNDFLERARARRRVKGAYLTRYYHQPSDEYDSRWRLDGAAADLRLILECLVRAAEADRAPAWAPGDEFEKLR